MDTLDAGDIAIFASPCAFRRPHYEYAIEKKTQCFHGKASDPRWTFLQENSRRQ